MIIGARIILGMGKGPVTEVVDTPQTAITNESTFGANKD